MPNDNIIFFPEHKRKREVKKQQDTKFAEELKKKQTKDFVETLVDEIGFDLLKKFVDAGMRTQNHNFTKDLAIVIDTIRGLAYRDFDMPHPTKNGWRLRHVCLEGPEAAVYVRGRLTNSDKIELPEYWSGLIDPETITVSLTQIGSSQDLIVEKIPWGKTIHIKSGNATAIDCYYYVQAERKDGEKLIVEYEGTSIDDYPGDNSLYTHNK